MAAEWKPGAVVMYVGKRKEVYGYVIQLVERLPAAPEKCEPGEWWKTVPPFPHHTTPYSLCAKHALKLLDDPGDDEVDEISRVKETSDGTHHSHPA